MSAQPKALLIADSLEFFSGIDLNPAAAELRQLHEANKQLKNLNDAYLSLVDALRKERIINHNNHVQLEREACASLVEELTRVGTNSLKTSQLGNKIAASIRNRGAA